MADSLLWRTTGAQAVAIHCYVAECADAPTERARPHPILAEATTGSGGVLIRDTKSEMVSSLCQPGRALLRADPQESQRDTHNTVAQIKGNQGISPS